MKMINEIEKLHGEMTAWRKDIHKYPELKFEEFRTSELVSTKLNEFGIEVHRGFAKTGVVGRISNGKGRSIGLRADMDALPLQEKNLFDHKSCNPGKMHACGHDGHTAMLLGAAKYLSVSRNFKGTVNFIFQPAEEGGGGGEVMIKDGLFEKFPMDSVYGLHNWPNIPAGIFGIGAGPIMAAADTFDLTINGKGGHAAMPDQCKDPIFIASQVLSAFQAIPSRKTHPLDSVVISITKIQAGDTYNIIPDSLEMSGTIRTFIKDTQNHTLENIRRIANGICKSFGATCELKFFYGYPATVNSIQETDISSNTVIELFGKEKLIRNPKPSMGSEDFAYMLQEKPGCYVWLGVGPSANEEGCMLHSSSYDFNDEVLTIGASYWVKLVENTLSL